MASTSAGAEERESKQHLAWAKGDLQLPELIEGIESWRLLVQLRMMDFESLECVLVDMVISEAHQYKSEAKAHLCA